jgi:hypothetical protein
VLNYGHLLPPPKKNFNKLNLASNIIICNKIINVYSYSYTLSNFIHLLALKKLKKVYKKLDNDSILLYYSHYSGGSGMKEVHKINFTAEERSQLEALASKRSAEHRLVTRANIIFLADDGKNNREIASIVNCSKRNVIKWRKRYLKFSVLGLVIDPEVSDSR